jgi:hypothetical protein
LASGIELVLKEHLRHEDWILIFKQPEKVEEDDFTVDTAEGL